MSGKHRRPADGKGRRRIAATAFVTVLTPAAGTLGAAAAFAADYPSTAADFTGGTYNGQASADGVRATISLKDYLIVEDVLDGGGPTAQASLDSLGESTAFSSLPYPGATGVGATGLVSTLSGKSLPSYPFFILSQNPSNPEVTVKQPGYLLHAESDADHSAAQTEVGATTTSGEEVGSFSTAAVDVVAGTITSVGEARTRLAVGALAINGALSKATITRTPDGKVVKTSSFEASSIRLGALQIGVTDKGLVVGPEGAPLDAARQVGETITNAGVTVKFLPAVETADSVLSSGLEISMEQPIPNVGSAKGVVRYIVGRTFAQADSAGFVRTTGTPVTALDSASGIAGVAPPGTVSAGVDAAGFGTVRIEGGVVAGAVPGAAPVAQPAPATVDLVNAAVAARPLTEISFYPLLAALVPILLLAAVGARRFV